MGITIPTNKTSTILIKEVPPLLKKNNYVQYKPKDYLIKYFKLNIHVFIQ